MRYSVLLFTLLCPVLLLVGCSEETTVAPEPGEQAQVQEISPEALARELVTQTGWTVAEEHADAAGEVALPQCMHGHWIEFIGRETLADEVAHYEWRVRVGQGEYDVIGLHRIVKERRPWRPVRVRENVFMAHGDLKTFIGCFQPGLLSSHYPAEFGIAHHLATEEIDVWGIDHASTFVPAEATDLSFMADWGLQKHGDDIGTALGVARFVRLLTGSSFCKMNLLGYSGGSAQGFSLLNDETQRPSSLRHVGGFIPVDTGMLNDDPVYTQANCDVIAYYEELWAAGEYGEYSALLLFGEPARDDPDGMSPYIPDLTNLQAALAIATGPFYEGYPNHYWAGEFDENGIPTGLQYTDVDLLIDFMCNAPAYMPTFYTSQSMRAHCTGAEPWTEHLPDITVPLLWVSPAGGFAPWETYTLDVIGSTDITMLEIQLHPVEEQDLDFGHVDLFTADIAPGLVWDPILTWIRDHAE